MAWQVAAWKVAAVLVQFVAFLTQVVARTSWQNVIDVLSLLAAAWVTVVFAAALLRGLRAAAWGVALLVPIAAFVWHSGVLTPALVEELWHLALQATPLPMNAKAL